MKYRVDFIEEGGYVLTKLWGKPTYDKLKQIALEQVALAKSLGCTRFLTDARETKVDEPYRVITWLNNIYHETDFPRVGRKAMLLEGAGFDDHFLNLDMSSHGWMVRAFKTQAEAVEWLEDGHP